MKSFKESGSGVIGALCELLIGILLLINPVGFTSAIIIIVGIVLTANGIGNVVSYFQCAPQKGVIERKLSIGILSIAGGLFCVFRPYWFIATFPVLTFIYGLGTLVVGVFKVEVTVNMVRLKEDHWFWFALSAALTLVCAIIILCNPLSSTSALWMFVAIALIAEAIVDFVTVFFS